MVGRGIGKLACVGDPHLRGDGRAIIIRSAGMPKAPDAPASMSPKIRTGILGGRATVAPLTRRSEWPGVRGDRPEAVRQGQGSIHVLSGERTQPRTVHH